MAALLDTPSRVLRRVQQYEDMELPSLPSFQQDDLDDLDMSDSYGSDVGASRQYETSDVVKEVSEDDMGSVIAPRYASSEQSIEQSDAPTPKAPHRYADDGDRSASDLSAGSSIGGLSTRRDAGGVTGSAMYDDLSSYRGTLPNGTTYDHYDNEKHDSLSAGMQRSSNTSQDFMDAANTTGAHTEATATPGPAQRLGLRQSPLPDRGSAPYTAAETRIPSLSRSEVSGTDNEATTPNGSDQIASHEVHYNLSTRASISPPGAPSFRRSPTPSNTNGLDSPAKFTPSTSETVTPVAIRYMDQPSTAARAAATPFGYGGGNPLGDITPRFRNTAAAAAYTPSVDYSSTPRALLDDKERRKSHVLSVLASASLPSRVRNRGTPHPLRRVSVAPHTHSTSEDQSEVSSFATEQHEAIEEKKEDISSVSIASSQDLITDRKSHLRYQRGNTSVPDILMSTGLTTPGFSNDSRPDAIKIQKHLNMMNKQLLDTNADLAREAEEWRQECTRLISIMKEAGVDIDYDGLLGELRDDSADDSLELPKLNDSFRAAQATLPTKSASNQSPALLRELRQKDELIESLRLRLDAAETDKGVQASTADLQHQLDVAHQIHADLQADFAKKTQEHVQQFTEICQDFEEQVKGLESQLKDARAEAASLRRQEGEAGASPRAAEQERSSANVIAVQGRLEQAQETIKQLEQSLAQAQQGQTSNMADTGGDTRDLSHALQEAESVKTSLQDRIRTLEESLTALQEKLTQKDEILLQEEHHIEDLLTALEAHKAGEADARRQLDDVKAELEVLQDKAVAKDSDIESLRNKLEVAQLEQSFADQSVRDPIGANESLVAALEDRLDDAHREIGRLRHDLAEMPSRQSAMEAQEARIKALEVEKATLLDRVRTQPPPTPGLWAKSMMTSTPVHKVLSSLRTPKTPGQMKELSWLQTTIGDSNESVMRVQLDHLNQELKIANSQLDKNFGRLEEAGLGAVQLAEKLAAAKDKIAQLEDEVRRLSRESKLSREDLDDGRFKSERLEAALESVRAQMKIVQDDALAERERLHDENRRMRKLNAELQAKSDEELEVIAREAEELHKVTEDQLSEERDQVESLRRAKSDAESDLRVAQTKISRLENEIASLTSTARDSASADRETKEHLEIISQHEATIDSLQQSLRRARNTADRLQTELDSRTRDWEDAQNAVETLRAERTRISEELELFTQDLGHQREECSAFGKQLQALRQTQRSAELKHAQQVTELEDALHTAQQSVMIATRQAKDAHLKAMSLERKLSQHDQVLQSTTDKQRQKYKVQTRRLSAQIEYLKAKYARENTFRNALSLQKKFLLLLVGGMSLNEQATLRVIASMGVEIPTPPRPRRTLKAVGIAVLALVRARRAAEQWHTVQEVKTVALSGHVGRPRVSGA